MASLENDSPSETTIPSTLPELKALILNVTREATIKQQSYDCRKYGTFMNHFARWHLEGIFWGLFVLVMLLLCTASYSHAQSEELYIYDERHPNEAVEFKKKHKRQRFNAVITTTICFIAAAFCVALEGLAGTALNYCQQHKVINFYWAMWGLTQVGSLIAILGVTIHQWASLKEHDTPPWNIALGTPILVITASAFYVGKWIQKKWRLASGSEKEQEEIQPEPKLGSVKGLTSEGWIVAQFYGREWEQISGFQVMSLDSHGGARGRIALCSHNSHQQKPLPGGSLHSSENRI